jgi:hypothetical protein
LLFDVFFDVAEEFWHANVVGFDLAYCAQCLRKAHGLTIIDFAGEWLYHDFLLRSVVLRAHSDIIASSKLVVGILHIYLGLPHTLHDLDMNTL